MFDDVVDVMAGVGAVFDDVVDGLLEGSLFLSPGLSK